MCINYKWLIICILYFLSGHADAQNTEASTDTIYIEETEIIYDTIFIVDTLHIAKRRELNSMSCIEPKNLGVNVLQLDKEIRKVNLSVISENYSATISENDIILNENTKNLKSMKKFTFLGLMLFATQHFVIAQKDVGISAGGGLWWVNSNYNNPNAGGYFTPMPNVGLYMDFTLGDYLYLSTALDYYYLHRNIEYIPKIEETVFYLDRFQSPIILKYIKNERAENAYHQFSVPLQLGYKLGKIIPLIGVEYSYKIAANRVVDNLQTVDIHRLSLLLGIKYKMTDRILLELQYDYGITKDYIVTGNIRANSIYNRIDENEVFWKSNLIGLTVNYSLKKREDEE